MPHPIGTSVWVDFHTNDYERATAFYGQLFGWTWEPGGPEAGNHTMIRSRDGALVGGIMDVSAMTCPEGDPLPAAWAVYLAADDVVKRCDLATQHGGTVVVPAAEAGDAGRFAVVLDANAAPVGLWQAGAVDGYDVTGRHGSPVWFELMTDDYDKAADFYSAVFDADLRPMDTGDDTFGYATNGAQGSASWGLCDATALLPVDRMGWRVYFCADALEDAMRTIEELGGKVTDGPQDSPFGRVITVRDPEGAYFQINAPAQAQA